MAAGYYCMCNLIIALKTFKRKEFVIKTKKKKAFEKPEKTER